MKYLTILVVGTFLVSMSMAAFADEPSKFEKLEQDITTEAVEEGQMMQEARELPSALMTGEEDRAKVMREVEELRDQYKYDEDLSE